MPRNGLMSSGRLASLTFARSGGSLSPGRLEAESVLAGRAAACLVRPLTHWARPARVAPRSQLCPEPATSTVIAPSKTKPRQGGPASDGPAGHAAWPRWPVGPRPWARAALRTRVRFPWGRNVGRLFPQGLEEAKGEKDNTAGSPTTETTSHTPGRGQVGAEGASGFGKAAPRVEGEGEGEEGCECDPRAQQPPGHPQTALQLVPVGIRRGTSKKSGTY